MAENEEEKKEKKEPGKSHRSGRKKDITFISQIIIAVWIAFWCGWQFYKQISTGVAVPIWNFVVSALAIGLPFSPTYLSIVLDKIKEIKLDKLIHSDK